MTVAALRTPFPAYPTDHPAMTIEPPKRLAIELPDHERGRNPDDLKRLDILNRRIAKPLPKGDKKAEREREDNLREREALEARPRLAVDNRWARAAVEESAALARGRGESVTEDRSGIKRILDRDPLAGLTWLTEDQFSAGRHMQECYLRRGEDAGAVEYTGMPGAPHDNGRFVFNRMKRAKATNMAAKVERAVAIQCSHEPAALQMLRIVCEQGFTLTSQGRGRAYDRNCKALAMALDVADSEIKRR